MLPLLCHLVLHFSKYALPLRQQLFLDLPAQGFYVFRLHGRLLRLGLEPGDVLAYLPHAAAQEHPRDEQAGQDDKRQKSQSTGQKSDSA